MNPDIKDRWLHELEFNRYRHGKGYLKFQSLTHTKHCCLGVLCELAVADGVILPSVRVDHGVHKFQYDECMLPAVVMNWAGLDIATAKGLAHLNDAARTTNYGPVIEAIRAAL